MTRFITLITLLGIASLSLVRADEFAEGYTLFRRGDYQAAWRVWVDLAASGDARAQFNLGQMYRLGLGVQQDDTEAVMWYAKAADQAFPQARHNLNLMAKHDRTARPAPQSNSATNIDDTASQTPALTEAPPPPPMMPLTATPSSDTLDRSATPAAATASNVIQPASTAADSVAWLRQLDRNQVMIQLAASASEQQTQTLATTYRQSLVVAPVIVPTLSKGKDWFVLLLGPYADQTQAGAALAQLPAPLRRSKPWLRSVGSIQAALR